MAASCFLLCFSWLAVSAICASLDRIYKVVQAEKQLALAANTASFAHHS
jgi:hypothetical protein